MTMTLWLTVDEIELADDQTKELVTCSAVAGDTVQPYRNREGADEATKLLTNNAITSNTEGKISAVTIVLEMDHCPLEVGDVFNLYGHFEGSRTDSLVPPVSGEGDGETKDETAPGPDVAKVAPADSQQQADSNNWGAAGEPAVPPTEQPPASVQDAPAEQQTKES